MIFFHICLSLCHWADIDGVSKSYVRKCAMEVQCFNDRQSGLARGADASVVVSACQFKTILFTL